MGPAPTGEIGNFHAGRDTITLVPDCGGAAGQPAALPGGAGS